MPVDMNQIRKWVIDNVEKYNKSMIGRPVLPMNMPRGYEGGGDVSPYPRNMSPLPEITGKIPGRENPGTGDDIDIHAKVGEYVLPLSVVHYYGTKFLDGLKEKALKATQGKSDEHYDLGGDVQSTVQPSGSNAQNIAGLLKKASDVFKPKSEIHPQELARGMGAQVMPASTGNSPVPYGLGIKTKIGDIPDFGHYQEGGTVEDVRKRYMAGQDYQEPVQPQSNTPVPTATVNSQPTKAAAPANVPITDTTRPMSPVPSNYNPDVYNLKVPETPAKKGMDWDAFSRILGETAHGMVPPHLPTLGSALGGAVADYEYNKEAKERQERIDAINRQNVASEMAARGSTARYQDIEGQAKIAGIKGDNSPLPDFVVKQHPELAGMTIGQARELKDFINTDNLPIPKSLLESHPEIEGWTPKQVKEYLPLLKGDKEPGSDFAVFERGLRDKLDKDPAYQKDGKPDKGAIDREISKQWETLQDKRSQTKTIVNLIEHEKSQERVKQRAATESSALLLKKIGGQENMDYYAERFVRYKELPPIGMGENERWAFFGMAANWAREHGMDAQATEISQMQTAAGKAALSSISKTEAVSKVAGEAAIKHGNTALEIMDKVDRTGSPVIDRWWRAGRKAVAGDPDVTAFDTNVHFFNRETARYLTSMTAGGQMSQDESNQIQNLVSSAENPAQFANNYRTIVRLIREKERSFREIKQDIQSGIPGGKSPVPSGAGTSKPSLDSFWR